ncbi:MAG: hypothetical protein JW782_06360 [Candidatus Saganbacteria bacterium]|nr:hypothetical protein [Candidatus Saganbacteria bacterium]
MRYLIISALVLFLAGQVLSADAITSIIGHATGSEKQGTDPYMSGDLWIRVHEPERAKLDFDLQFEKANSKLNIAQIKLLLPVTDVILGRQQIGWGVGYAVNPIDIINPRPIGSSFDPTFVRDGRDAVAASAYLGSYSKIELIAASNFSDTKDYDGTAVVQDFRPDSGARIKANLAGCDVAASYINKGERSYNGNISPEDRVWGAEFNGTVPFIGCGLWNETAFYTEANKTELVVGTDYYFGDYHFILEYYRNGFGTADRTAYDPTLLLQGRLMARDYFIPTLSWRVNQKMTLTGFAFYNTDDWGIIGGGVVDYFINNNLEFVFMPYFLKGGADTEVGLQKTAVGRYGAEALFKLVI